MLLCCATFPLIWVGGLVTTYNAGMAVPDWPNTFGYNLFLYPWQTWLFGPWDLFIEHGHRLLGATVGLLAIAFLASVWSCDERSWLRVLSVVTLVAVIFQGVLGGMRVIFDARTVAQLHGCVGPAFFALTAALCTLTTIRWNQAERVVDVSAGKLQRLSLLTTGLAYLQLMLGSVIRHQPVGGSPLAFQVVVYFHLAMAAAVLVHVLLLARWVFRHYRNERWMTNPAIALVGLVTVQLLLGAGVWLVKFGPPAWLESLGTVGTYAITTVQAEGFTASHVRTAHVAVGSLIIAAGLLVSLRSYRLFQAPARLLVAAPLMLEAAR